jgi:hypothetical protein
MRFGRHWSSNIRLASLLLLRRERSILEEGLAALHNGKMQDSPDPEDDLITELERFVIVIPILVAILVLLPSLCGLPKAKSD